MKHKNHLYRKFISILAGFIYFFKITFRRRRYNYAYSLCRVWALVSLCVVVFLIGSREGNVRAYQEIYDQYITKSTVFDTPETKSLTASDGSSTEISSNIHAESHEGDTSDSSITVSNADTDEPANVYTADYFRAFAEQNAKSDPSKSETLGYVSYHKPSELESAPIINTFDHATALSSDTEANVTPVPLPWYELIDVDLNGLRKINPEIIAWIYFENEEISYPILKSEDNAKYLHKNFQGDYADGGSIFLESMNHEDFTDKHTIIYGHNMRDLSMFGRLKNYKLDYDYYQHHQYFQIITTDENGAIVKYRYHIFSCKDVETDDDIYYIFDPSYAYLADFSAVVIQKGNYLKNPADIAIVDDDHIITLSTCSNEDKRFTVSAVREEAHSN